MADLLARLEFPRVKKGWETKSFNPNYAFDYIVAWKKKKKKVIIVMAHFHYMYINVYGDEWGGS